MKKGALFAPAVPGTFRPFHMPENGKNINKINAFQWNDFSLKVALCGGHFSAPHDRSVPLDS